MNDFTGLPHRLRVLHVGKYYPPQIGGIESHIQTLCSELRKYIDATVLVANAGREDHHEIAGSVPVTRAGTLVRLAGSPVCPSMAQKIRESGVDLVHLHLPNPTAAIAYVASGFRGPLVITWHSDIVRQKFLKKLFMPIECRLLQEARVIIASSPDYVAYSSALYEHRVRCRVIPFGISVDQGRDRDNGEISTIERLYRRPLLLSIGRMVGYKGYRYLVRAMKHINATLLLIGDGPERLNLEAEVRSLGISEQVHFLGRVEQTAPYYQACDLFVLPSVGRNEAFGIVQLEAMAYGKPVVNTQLRSGVPFVSVNGFTGITVPPADAQALARAINVLLDDPIRLSAYGAAAKTRVQREFTLERMVSETLRVYEEVLG
jgi:glycosyltransferase involved in cell wall biosynthesis